MNNILHSLVLGLVQGLTEFLPVSSSGHLLLLETLGVGEPSLLFNVLLHVGSLAAVLIVFGKAAVGLFRRPNRKKLWYIVLASIPTGILAFAFKYFLPTLLDGAYLAVGFAATSCLLFSTKFFSRDTLRPISGKSAMVCGFAQGIAVLPGVSRSGATVSALMLMGVEKEEALEFSFLLSIPIIIASAAYESLDFFRGDAVVSVNPWAVAVGVAAAFVSGLLALLFLKKFIKKRSFVPFAVYTLIMAAVTLGLKFM